MKKNGNFITLCGRFDGVAADEVVKAMNADESYNLDFSDVTDINFAGLRALLRCRQNGQRFNVINAADAVVEKFEDTGVSTFIDVCRKPKPLSMGQYDEFGAGYLSKAYNSEDGDSMMKVYGDRVPKWVVYREKTIAKQVMIFGIPTPLVGSLYEDGGNTGLDFERIPGKRSFSRIISEEPERLREITIRFARMCKKLHTTECNTRVFSDRTNHYRNAVMNSTQITDEEKQKALRFIDNVPAETTCLHGDMQLSNVITNDKDDLWIDLSDFGYGNHMFDMGMWYFLSVLNTEELMDHIFHLKKKQMLEVWDIFVEEYFSATTDEEKAAVVKQVEPFAALHMLYIGSAYGFEPGMIEYIKEKLF